MITDSTLKGLNDADVEIFPVDLDYADDILCYFSIRMTIHSQL